MFSHAKAIGVVNSNPVEGAKSLVPARRPAETVAYTEDEVMVIIAALEGDPLAQLACGLAYYCGLRPSELASLRWDDFDADVVHVQRAAVAGIPSE